MKKTFLAKRNALLSPAGLSAPLVAVFVVLVLVFLKFAFPNAFLRIFAPVFRMGANIEGQISAFSTGFEDSMRLAARNDELATQNAERAIENRILAEKLADLEKLGVATASENFGIPAGVLARPPESPYDTLLVDAGSARGVTLGMEAFGVGGAPAGLVTSVSESFSYVTLFSSSGEKVAGWVGKNRLPLTLLGMGGGAFGASISKTAQVSVGDAVFIPGPGARLVGTVTKISNDPSSPSVTLFIAPVLNPFSITWLVVRDVGKTFVMPPADTIDS